MVAITLDQMWKQYSDADMTKFWLLQHPSNFASIIVTGVSLIAVVLPKVVSRNLQFFATRDYRPLMIIFNGFFFGTFGAGLPLVYFTTRRGSDFFACDAIPASRKDLTAIALKHLAVVFLVIMLLELGVFAIRVIRRKKVTASEVLHQMSWTLLMYTTMTIHPTGFTILAACLHMMTRICTYGYFALTVMSREPKVWRIYVHAFEIASNFAIVLHHSYYLTQPQCGNFFTTLVTNLYCALRACFLLIRFNSLYRPRAKCLTE